MPAPAENPPGHLLRIILIDDEPPAREEVRRLLADQPGIEIVGEAGNVTAARRRLRKAADYDLVLLDVQLIGGSGFDLVRDIAPTAHVVFFTAHEQHALRAFEVNAVDYLLKPVSADRLGEALRRVTDQASSRPVSRSTRSPLQPADSVLVRCQDGSEFVALDDISLIEAQQNYTRLSLRSGRELMMLRPLKDWESELPAEIFARLHRSLLVNLQAIKHVKHDLTGRPSLHLAGRDEPVRASRRQWAEIRNRLPSS